MYNILIEFGVPQKLVRLIKMCLTETYSMFSYSYIFQPCMVIRLAKRRNTYLELRFQCITYVLCMYRIKLDGITGVGTWYGLDDLGFDPSGDKKLSSPYSSRPALYTELYTGCSENYQNYTEIYCGY